MAKRFLALLIASASIPSIAAAQTGPSNSNSPIAQDADCDPMQDLSGLRNFLQRRVVEIDQKQLYPAATQDEIKLLQSQAMVVEVAVTNFDTWKKAFDDYKTKHAAVVAGEAYLNALADVSLQVAGPGQAAAAQLLQDQQKSLGSLKAAQTTARSSTCSAALRLRQYHTIAENMVVPNISAPLRDDHSQRGIVERAECIRGFELPATDVSFSSCLVAPFNDQTRPQPSLGNSETTSVAVPDSPLRKRGFTTSFSGSKVDTKIGFQFADEYNVRSYSKAGQRFKTWGWSLGVVTDGGTLLDLDRDGTRNVDEFESGFDRISGSTKLTGSLSFNIYPYESKEQFELRAAPIQEKVYAACIKSRAEKKSQAGCVGQDLRDWLIERDENDVQTNKAMADLYSDLYFGKGKGVTNARLGFVLNGEIARPRLKYKLFDTAGVLGAEMDSRYWNYSIGGTGYWRFDLGTYTDFTAVASLTYKQQWRDYFASDEKKDRTDLPVLDEGFAPSLEGRFLWRGRGKLPATAIMPKLTFDLAANRDRFDLPVLFLFGDKLDSSAGIQYTRKWGGNYDDGPGLPTTGEISIVYQKTFSILP